MNERTFQAQEAHRLEDPKRLEWLPPAEVVAHLALRPQMMVADIGAGTGYFTLPIARAVSPGTVFAVDLQPEMLQLLEAKLADAPGNIILRSGDAAETGLDSRSVDRVLLANLWHELDDHAAVLKEAERLLRPGGQIAILDWRSDVAGPPGPPPEHRIAQAEAEETLREQGWTVEGGMSIGRYSYLLLASFFAAPAVN